MDKHPQAAKKQNVFQPQSVIPTSEVSGMRPLAVNQKKAPTQANVFQNPVQKAPAKAKPDAQAPAKQVRAPQAKKTPAPAPKQAPRSKGKDSPELRVKEKALKRSQTEQISAKRSKIKHKAEPWQVEYLKGAKVYKLTAFTTVDSIEKKFKIYQRQAVLSKILITLILIFFIFTIIGLKFSDPIKEILRTLVN
ncbi:MAG: hypothetical protein Q4E09_02135 [Eubacteriales bacterium]|nr:hypothetical protein [Eubacteriales bacterium]